MKIGFIGLGIMGKPMARNLLKAGYDLTVSTRNQATVAELVAELNGNIIRLDHNQFVNINRQSGVELKVTLEAFGHDHKDRILEALSQAGYQAHEVDTTDFYH